MVIDMYYIQYSERQCHSNKNYSGLPTMTLENTLILVFASKIFPNVTISISCDNLRSTVQLVISLPIKCHCPNDNSIFYFP